MIRALGAHRYVAGRLHLAHALALAAVESPPAVLEASCLWARDVAASFHSEPNAEGAMRPITDGELCALVEAFWTPGTTAGRRLAEALDRACIAIPALAPFDEREEARMRPVAIDAGWELLPLGELDPGRHKGAIDAFETPLDYAAALAREAAFADGPSIVELPALGVVELLRAARSDGSLTEPLVAWVRGEPAYVDYVLRGVRRAAKTDALADEADELAR